MKMKNSRHPKKAALVSFVAGLAVVAMASTAFACTQIVGEVAMTPVVGTGSANYKAKTGDQLSTGYCSTTPATRKTFTTAAPATVLTFRLDVKAVTTCADTGTTYEALADGVYEVRWIASGDAVTYNSPGAPNCHFNSPYFAQTYDPTPDYKVLGDLTVAAGTGTGVFGLPTTSVAPTLGSGNICLQLLQPEAVIAVPPTDATAMGYAPPAIFMKWTTV